MNDCPHTHTDTIPHIAPGELEAQRKASTRAWLSLMLATTPEGWTALLKGDSLPHDQLDPAQLQRARRRHKGGT